MTLNARNNIKYVSLNGYAKQKSLIWNNASTVKAFGRFKSFMFYVLTFCSVWHTVIKKITKYCKWANKQWRDKTKEQQSWVLGAAAVFIDCEIFALEFYRIIPNIHHLWLLFIVNSMFCHIEIFARAELIKWYERRIVF